MTKMPDERPSNTQKFRVGGVKGWYIVGENAQGLPNELCIIIATNEHPTVPLPELPDALLEHEEFASYYSQLTEYEAQVGEQIRQLHGGLIGLLNVFGIAVSMYLQAGGSLKDAIDKFSHTRFPPAGRTTDPDIRVASSIPDYIMRKIKVRYKIKETDHEQAGAPEGGTEEAGGEGEDGGRKDQ